MAEDNPTNPESGENDPLYDPFDMLNGNTSGSGTPPQKEDGTHTTSHDPFDLVERHDTTPPQKEDGTYTPPYDPFDLVERHDTTPPQKEDGTYTPPYDPFDLVERHDTNTNILSDPFDLVEKHETPNSIPSTPTNTNTTPSVQPGQSSNTQPIATPSVNPSYQPTSTPPPTTKTSSTREAYESRLDLDAVMRASNPGNKISAIDNTSLGHLDEALFINHKRVKVDPEENAEAQAKLKYLVKKIQKDLNFYRQKEKKAGKGSLTFSVLSSLLAASVTVLLGLNVTTWMRNNNFDWYINTIALVISAFISVIGVVQNFVDAKPLWIKYTDTANKYQQLLDNIEYLELAKGYISLEDVNQIKLTYNRIQEGTHNYIIQVRSQEDVGNTNMLKR